MTVQYSVGKTNCLTEVPNNVKLRLDNGILTLEKGSKVYIPNGYDINTNIIGSPTIVNGVVSGFSDVNFLKLDKPFNPESNYFEIQFKFITNTLTTDVEQYIFSSIQDETADGRIGFRIYYRGDKLMLSEASLDGKSWVYANTGTTSLISNTTYYVKVIRDNTTTSLYLRTEDTDWILECQMSQVSSTVFKYSYIGQWRGSNGYGSTTKCSVDLSQSYIKINDEMFWQGGDGNGKPVFKEHTIQNDITADTSTYTGFYCYGFGDYGDWLTVLTSGVSSATIPTTSGLMGWYDMTANRIKRWHGSSSTWQDNDFSLPLCYCTSSDGKLVINQIFNDFSYIGGQTFALPGIKGLIPNGWNEDGTYKTIEFEIDEVIRGNVEFNNNVANYGVINLENNGNLTLCRSAKSDTSYNEETNLIYRSDGLFPNSTIAFETQSSSNIISTFVPTQVKTTNDLKNMQIKYGVGNTNCLTSVPQNINLELDPLNVTVVGTPTINNGVITEFSSTNYLLLPTTFNPASSVWKKYFKIKTPSDISKNIAIAGSKESQDFQHSAAGVSNNAHWTCWLSSNGTSWDIAKGTEGTYLVQPDTVYWVTLEFTGSSYILKYSLNGIDYIQDIIINTETVIYNGQNTPDMLGNGGTVLTSSTWQPVNTIYLTECYYTINGKEIWRGGTGNLTLKKGSKVYVPNGFEEDGITKKFDEVVIENDVIATNYTGYTFTAFVCYVPELNRVLFDTEYTGSGNGFEYNTEENYLRLTGSYTDATWTGKLTTLPLGLIEMSSSIGVTSIMQVFNGFGFMGNLVFALPGVKGLIPNGWNENGTYKSITFETNNVIMKTISNVSSTLPLFINDKQIEPMLYWLPNGDEGKIYSVWYDKDTNVNLWRQADTTVVKDGWFASPCGNYIQTDANAKIILLSQYETKTTNDTIDIKEVHQGVGKTNCLIELPNDINLELDPLNVTVVGTPTNSNGVVSGFSASNYVKTNEIPPFDNALSFEIVIKFTINSLSGLQGFAGMLTGDNVQCNYYISSANKLCSDGIYGNLEGLTTLSIGQTYWSKLSYDGSKYDLLLSTNGIDYNLESSVTTNSKITTVSNFAFGVDRNAVTGNNHSIDLKESYIKINDEYWWRGGTGHATLKSGSKVYVPNGFEEENYYKYNVTKIGSPTLTNGIANNFSVGNLLTLNDSFNVEDKNWEVGVKITTGSSISGGQTIWGSIPDYNGFLLRANNGTVTLWLSTNGTSWNGLSSVASTLVLQPNTTYYIKLSFNGTQYLIDASNDGVNYNNYLTHSSTVLMIENHSTIGGHGVTTSLYDTPFLGSIDLTQSYIKINDEIIWQGIIEGTKTDNDYVVYSGNKKFDEVVIENDLIVSIADNNEYFIFYNMNDNNLWFSADEYTRSGSSNPSDLWGFFYNSTDNKVYYLRNGTTPDELTFSLPVTIVVSNVSSGITSVNQIFNGFGYIGSRYFMTAGVKCLEPDGWNKDVTYKVNERQSSNVYVSAEQTDDVTNRAICLTYNSNNELISDFMTNYYETQSRSDVSTGGWYFIKDENQIENFNGTTWQGKVYRTKVGSYQVTSGKITNFKVDNIKTTNDTKILY